MNISRNFNYCTKAEPKNTVGFKGTLIKSEEFNALVRNRPELFDKAVLKAIDSIGERTPEKIETCVTIHKQSDEIAFFPTRGRVGCFDITAITEEKLKGIKKFIGQYVDADGKFAFWIN